METLTDIMTVIFEEGNLQLIPEKLPTYLQIIKRDSPELVLTYHFEKFPDTYNYTLLPHADFLWEFLDYQNVQKIIFSLSSNSHALLNFSKFMGKCFEINLIEIIENLSDTSNSNIKTVIKMYKDYPTNFHKSMIDERLFQIGEVSGQMLRKTSILLESKGFKRFN